MAIVKMKKLRLLALRSERDELLKELMLPRLVEISEPACGPGGRGDCPPSSGKAQAPRGGQKRGVGHRAGQSGCSTSTPPPKIPLLARAPRWEKAIFSTMFPERSTARFRCNHRPGRPHSSSRCGREPRTVTDRLAGPLGCAGRPARLHRHRHDRRPPRDGARGGRARRAEGTGLRRLPRVGGIRRLLRQNAALSRNHLPQVRCRRGDGALRELACSVGPSRHSGTAKEASPPARPVWGDGMAKEALAP